MPTNPDKQPESKDDDEGIVKYAVSCNCPHGERPKDEEMTKLADGDFECPACGRKYAGGEE